MDEMRFVVMLKYSNKVKDLTDKIVRILTKIINLIKMRWHSIWQLYFYSYTIPEHPELR